VLRCACVVWRVRNLQDGTTYTSQQLYWDNEKHEFYSNVPMHIVTPDRDLQGDQFRSDEQLTRYEVRRTRGFIPMPSSMSKVLLQLPTQQIQRNSSDYCAVFVFLAYFII